MGILVMGMHRSGTSAVTAAVAALGVPLGELSDRMPALAENPEGFHESVQLSAFNEFLLEALGGRWDAPPPLHPGWELGPIAANELAAARQLFREVHQEPTWVWKDPRICLLGTFWFTALGEHKTVFVTRDPLAVAHSIRRRNGLSKTYALALWERYTRHGLMALRGRPVMVVDYTAIMNEPAELRRWSVELAKFVGDDLAGDERHPADRIAMAAKPALRHNLGRTEAIEHDAEVSPAQRELASVLRGLTGSHDALALPDLPVETPRTEERIEAHRQCRGRECPHRTVRVTVARSPGVPFSELAATGGRPGVSGTGSGDGRGGRR